MDKREAEFFAKLFAIFKIEAEEHIKNLADGLLEIEKPLPANKKQELLDTIFREAHSLKGAARAVNLNFVENVCQALENILASWKKGQISPSPALFDTLHTTIDVVNKEIQEAQSASSEENAILTGLTERLYALQQQQTERVASPSEESKEVSQAACSLSLSKPHMPSSDDFNKNHSLEQGIGRTEKKTIRVDTTKLDKLFQQVEEMLVVKLTSNQRLSDFKHLYEKISEWDQEWMNVQSDIHALQSNHQDSLIQNFPSLERLVPFLQWQQAAIKDLKNQLSHLIKISSQDHRLVNNMVDSLLDDTKKILMQPFSIIFDVFPRMVRDISRTLDKEIHLELRGGDIEIDRRILEELKDPLIHLIRNSIDHGIEISQKRAEHQKPPFGTIIVAASQVSGSSVEVLVSDDGRGIDVEKVKQTALKQGIISEREYRDLNDEDALKLIFQSGVSTSSIVTELSGRGLGLGIVAEKVEKLGGQIFIETKVHQGTTFRILLPLTLATFRGIHIQAANHDFIIPTQNVKKVLKIKLNEIKTIEGKEIITLDGRHLSFIFLKDLLNLASPEKVRKSDTLFILVIKAAETTIAIGIDQIFNEKEVLIKSLGKQLANVKNIAAATVTESGKVIPILDPFDLIKSAIQQSGAISRHTISALETILKPNEKKTILVVEDSVTARILLKNILESAGYEVKTAIDGAEGFSILKTEKIDLLLSDVEMPRMNGFELTQKVRQTDELHDLPIILCTSRGSKEDREHGITVGANAYIDKSSFAHSNLLEIVQKLL